MFCRNCGNQLEEGWKVCPMCGNEMITVAGQGTAEEKEPEPTDNMEREEDDSIEQIELIKRLLHDHPVRSILCVPVVINIIFQVCRIFTYDFYDVIHNLSLYNLIIVVNDFLPVIANFAFCDVAVWILFGPENYKQVKGAVTGKVQKGNGTAWHIIELIIAFVLILLHQ